VIASAAPLAAAEPIRPPDGRIPPAANRSDPRRFRRPPRSPDAPADDSQREPSGREGHSSEPSQPGANDDTPRRIDILVAPH
jgi:hypothetical protein